MKFIATHSIHLPSCFGVIFVLTNLLEQVRAALLTQRAEYRDIFSNWSHITRCSQFPCKKALNQDEI